MAVSLLSTHRSRHLPDGWPERKARKKYKERERDMELAKRERDRNKEGEKVLDY